ncbi:NLR family CARD domain-containing protein 3 [Nibea albiflora]|uniref:NLR family CARD domain-containing protein 3 n=1 Tax=Nibea albiflora TaxID=240163 RepID=A0ACB7ECE4_NIBAL|nr:NLR family CARD domain-containing protein 3 [Nibea albiflora]
MLSCCPVSGRSEGSGLYQLWTLVLQTLHRLRLVPVFFIRRLFLSPVWKKIQNKLWTADSQSDQHHTTSSVFIWITSRPAATNQIPPSFFFWITVLDHMLTTDQREQPKTLTDMYSHFLLVQTKRKKKMYNEGHEMSPQELTKADREVLLKLGRLVFEQLEKGNIMLYQEDLEQCGLDVTEASMYSGVCTKIFKRESVMFQKIVYCFVHLSVPDFLAAVYLFHCYTTNKKTEVLKAFLKGENYSTLDVFLVKAMQKSLQSKNGHLGLFVLFPSWLLSGGFWVRQTTVHKSSREPSTSRRRRTLIISRLTETTTPSTV